jgi:glycogen operon protein
LRQDIGSEFARHTLNEVLREANGTWHGVKFGKPDWSFDSHSLAYSATYRNENMMFYVILNAYWEALEFELPPTSKTEAPWRRWIDSSLDSPDDIVEWHTMPPVATPTYRAGPRSVVALFVPAQASSVRTIAEHT